WIARQELSPATEFLPTYMPLSKGTCGNPVCNWGCWEGPCGWAPGPELSGCAAVWGDAFDVFWATGGALEFLDRALWPVAAVGVDWPAAVSENALARQRAKMPGIRIKKLLLI